MDILVSGIRRFRMVKTLRLHSYDSAEIEVVEDEAGDWNEAHATEVYQLHRSLLSSITGKLPEDQMYAGKHLLSFVVMPSSGLTADEKQELLEMTSEDARLESLSRHYKALLGAVEYVQMAGRSIQAWCDLKDFLTARRDEDSNGWKP